MPDLSIPQFITPADIIGPTRMLAGQRWLFRSVVLDYAQRMLNGAFDWDEWQAEQPMAVQVMPHGVMLDQGHHRWAAAKLARMAIPVEIEVRYDWWPQDAPFAVTWDQVEWEDESTG
jgi:hypothetical protein